MNSSHKNFSTAVVNNNSFSHSQNYVFYEVMFTSFLQKVDIKCVVQMQWNPFDLLLMGHKIQAELCDGWMKDVL